MLKADFAYNNSTASRLPKTDDRLERFLIVGIALQESLEDVADALLLIHEAMPNEGHAPGALHLTIGYLLDDLEDFGREIKRAKGEIA